MTITHINKKGFALLYIMLILASMITVASLSASQFGVFSSSRQKSYGSAADARMLTMYCAEILLMQVKNSPATVSSGTLNYNSGTCTYSISGTIPNKTITITASKNNAYRRLTITTSQINPTIVSMWVESL